MEGLIINELTRLFFLKKILLIYNKLTATIPVLRPNKIFIDIAFNDCAATTNAMVLWIHLNRQFMYTKKTVQE